MAPLEGDYLVFRGVKAKAALSTLSSLPGKKIVPEPEKRMMVWVPGSQGLSESRVLLLAVTQRDVFILEENS